MPAPRTQFEFELRDLIAQRIQDARDILETNNFETVSDFKFTMGRISELRGMGELIEQAYERLDKR